MIFDYLAYLAQALFVGATLSQLALTVRQGHSRGLSHALIWQLILGFSIMTGYTIIKYDADPVLLTGYLGQLIPFLAIAGYKYFPQNRG
jgi:uncharacterized membrane protein YhaH (DUF805 family)